jgi:opacity protein-like surface antigen
MKTARFSLILAAAALAASAAVAATITVLVQTTAVRKRPQFYAPAAATAKLGDSFEADGPTAGWYKVDAGYIHQSAVSTKKVKLSEDSTVNGGGGATADEVTLAGKGFNSQVESSYSAQNKSANFPAVDAMEKRTVPDAQELEFLRRGGLIPKGDAQ